MNKQAKELDSLINVVDMYLDTEQKHYKENPSDDHIFHSLLNLSHWLKENHTMIPSEAILDDKKKEIISIYIFNLIKTIQGLSILCFKNNLIDTKKLMKITNRSSQAFGSISSIINCSPQQILDAFFSSVKLDKETSKRLNNELEKIRKERQGNVKIQNNK